MSCVNGKPSRRVERGATEDSSQQKNSPAVSELYADALLPMPSLCEQLLPQLSVTGPLLAPPPRHTEGTTAASAERLAPPKRRSVQRSSGGEPSTASVAVPTILFDNSPVLQEEESDETRNTSCTAISAIDRSIANERRISALIQFMSASSVASSRMSSPSSPQQQDSEQQNFLGPYLRQPCMDPDDRRSPPVLGTFRRGYRRSFDFSVSNASTAGGARTVPADSASPIRNNGSALSGSNLITAASAPVLRNTKAPHPPPAPPNLESCGRARNYTFSRSPLRSQNDGSSSAGAQGTNSEAVSMDQQTPLKLSRQTTDEESSPIASKPLVQQPPKLVLRDVATLRAEHRKKAEALRDFTRNRSQQQLTQQAPSEFSMLGSSPAIHVPVPPSEPPLLHRSDHPTVIPTLFEVSPSIMMDGSIRDDAFRSMEGKSAPDCKSRTMTVRTSMKEKHSSQTSHVIEFAHCEDQLLRSDHGPTPHPPPPPPLPVVVVDPAKAHYPTVYAPVLSGDDKRISFPTLLGSSVAVSTGSFSPMGGTSQNGEGDNEKLTPRPPSIDPKSEPRHAPIHHSVKAQLDAEKSMKTDTSKEIKVETDKKVHPQNTLSDVMPQASPPGQSSKGTSFRSSALLVSHNSREDDLVLPPISQAAASTSTSPPPPPVSKPSSVSSSSKGSKFKFRWVSPFSLAAAVPSMEGKSDLVDDGTAPLDKNESNSSDQDSEEEKKSLRSVLSFMCRPSL